MLTVSYGNQFKKDLKKYKKQKRVIREFKDLIIKLSNNKNLPEKYKDHKLKGEFKGYRECHLFPDILLIYRITDHIFLLRIGSHADLFE